MSSNWFELIKNTKVTALVKPDFKLISVNSDEPINYILTVFKENNILSVPVIKNNGILGFIDVLDISCYALHIWRTKRTKWTPHVLKKKFTKRNAENLINFSVKNQCIKVSPETSVFEALTMLSMKSFKTHRIAVVEPDTSKIVGIVSQSDMLMFANKHLDMIPADKTVGQLSLSRGCIMMNQKALFEDTLALLADNRISGLALVDDDDKLVTNFSASDLKGFKAELFEMFQMPTNEVLPLLKKNKTLVVSSEETKLRQCIETLAKERVHRLFIVRLENRPVGVVSLTDIMYLLVGERFPSPLEKSGAPTKL
jgi:CBS domain-containing protein